MPYLDDRYAPTGAGQMSDADVAMMMQRATAPQYASEVPSDLVPGAQPAAADVTGAGSPTYAPSYRERALDWVNRNLMSGGAGDIRNVATALGPAAQAAGGLGQAAAWAQRVGMPAKAQGAMSAADQMFDPSQAAPVMRAAAGQGGWVDPRILAVGAAVGAPLAYAAPTIWDLITRLRERNQEPGKQ